MPVARRFLLRLAPETTAETPESVIMRPPRPSPPVRPCPTSR